MTPSATRAEPLSIPDAAGAGAPATTTSTMLRGALRGLGRSLGSLLPYAFGFLTLFVAWHVAAVYVVQSVLFPAPLPVLRKGIELAASGVLFEQIAASLQRIAIGFVLGSAIGVPIGLLIGTVPLARKMIEPWTEFLRFIPSVAMISIAVIWFGIGENSKIFLIIYATLFIVTLNTASGVSTVSPNKLRAARALGASKAQIFALVALPATVPFILTGMRLAMANAFTTIVAAEMIAASDGLGVMLWNGRLYMLVDEIFVSLVCLGVLGFCFDRAFRWGILRFAGRYSPVT